MQILHSVGFLCLLFCYLDTVQSYEEKCTVSQYNKEVPSSESGMKACKQFSCNSCCFANLTAELADLPLKQVGGLNYSQCGPLSEMCSTFTSFMQCFYQCSPNLYPWISPDRRLNNVPICSTFCDQWFQACASDRTCVEGTDWTRGFEVVPDPNNAAIKTLQCKPGVKCRNYSQVYGNSENFCEKMWPGLFKYEKDEDACINPAGDEDENKNYFHNVVGPDDPYTECEDVEYVDAGAIIGIVLGCLVGLAVVCGAIIFCLRRNSAKDRKTTKASTDANKPKEMEELNRTEPLE